MTEFVKNEISLQSRRGGIELCKVGKTLMLSV